MEKKYFALVKALKDFRVYILHSHIIAFIANVIVKEILTHTDEKEKRGKWIAVILEYDVEIKPTKLIKGQGLAKMMVKSNLQALEINFIVSQSEDNDGEFVQ